MRCSFRCIIGILAVLILCWIPHVYVSYWTAEPPELQIGVVPVTSPVNLSEEQLQREWSTTALPSSVSVLEDVLTAIEKALDYLSTQTKSLNLDGILGIRLVDDQFSLLLDRYESSTVVESTINRDLLSIFNDIRWKARNVSETAIPNTNRSDPRYFYHVGAILRKGQWTRLDYPLRSLREANRTWPELKFDFAWNNSDACLNEILGTSLDPVAPCDMSDLCWKIMTFPEFSGYGLTHQLLFLEVAEVAGCRSHISNFSQLHGQGNVSVVHNYLCSNILSEAEAIKNLNYPLKYQDLFMEQIFLCGILGYHEFLTEEWLYLIMSWQDASGCYALDPSKGKRVKREERVLEDGCASHKTSVAMGALVTYARFLLISILENKVAM